MTWQNRLTQAREQAGMQKTDFAKACGVSTATTTDWENGEIKSLSAEKLLTICDVLDISPFWLMRGTAPNFSPEELELLDCFRTASPEGKAFLLRSARLEKKSTA